MPNRVFFVSHMGIVGEQLTVESSYFGGAQEVDSGHQSTVETSTSSTDIKLSVAMGLTYQQE